MLIVMLLCVAGIAVQAQPECITKVSTYRMSVTDLLTVNYQLKDGKVEQFNAPNFKGWKIAAGPTLKVSNLKNSNTIISTYTYILQPIAEGILEVPGASMLVNGEWLTSGSLQIAVSDLQPITAQSLIGQDVTDATAFTKDIGHLYEGYVLQSNEQPADKIRKHLFIKVEVPKNKVVEGETLEATYKLYCGVRLEAKLTKSPTFSGFSSRVMATNDALDYTLETIKGNQYKVYLIRKMALVALSPGLQQIAPIEIDATVTFSKIPSLKDIARSTTGNATNDTTFSTTIKSDPIPIEVAALPAQKSANFTGAVGAFSISARLDTTAFPLKQSAKLILTISGYGNWAMLAPPIVQWPLELMHYDPTISESIDSQSIAKGQKTYTFPIAGTKEGKCVIPPIQFMYYALSQKQYVLIQTDPVSLTITPPTPSFYSEETPDKNENVDIAAIFTDVVIVAFPLAALLLLVALLFRRKKLTKVPTASKSTKTNISLTVKDESTVQVAMNNNSTTIIPDNPTASNWAKSLRKEMLEALAKSKVLPVKENELTQLKLLIKLVEQQAFGPHPNKEIVENIMRQWELWKENQPR